MFIYMSSPTLQGAAVSDVSNANEQSLVAYPVSLVFILSFIACSAYKMLLINLLSEDSREFIILGNQIAKEYNILAINFGFVRTFLIHIVWI